MVSSPVRAPPIENLNSNNSNNLNSNYNNNSNHNLNSNNNIKINNNIDIDNQSNGDIDDDDLYYQGLSGTKINDVNRNIDQNVSRKKINQ